MRIVVSRLMLATSAAVALAGIAATVTLQPACAQQNPTLTNVIPDSEAATLHATITAIDRKSRAVSLRGRTGETVTVTAGPVVRLELLKVGDTVSARYYRSVAWELAGPPGGTATPGPSNDEMTTVLARPAQAPGGVAVRVAQISGTVVGIDLAAHRLEVVNPSGGGIYTIDVTNATRVEMLSRLKVGDTVTAVVSEAIAVSIESARKI
jgi:hypothetical protein